jgi:hypothetical protein
MSSCRRFVLSNWVWRSMSLPILVAAAPPLLSLKYQTAQYKAPHHTSPVSSFLHLFLSIQRFAIPIVLPSSPLASTPYVYPLLAMSHRYERVSFLAVARWEPS